LAEAIVTAIARPPFRQSRLAIPHLTQFAFARDRQKQIELNLPPHSNMVWREKRHVCAHLPTVSQRRKPAAAWFFSFNTLIVNSCYNLLQQYFGNYGILVPLLIER